jgi:branched-chain amino acid transport system permease protein
VNRTGLLLRVLPLLLALLLVAFLPRYISEFRAFQFANVGIYFIALVGLNILTGYTGQISLGHGAFMAIGGYTTAALVVHEGVRDLWTIPLAGLVAGGAGLLFGFPALRLSGVYLALATFAVAVATPSVLKRFEGLSGGSGGLILDLPAAPFGLPLGESDWLYYLAWGLAVVLLICGWLIVRGRVGRAFKAVRENEVAAISSGINLALYKTLAFGISAFYAGIAGSLLVISIAFVNPDTFPISLSILLLTGVVVGGLGSLSGVVVGALFIQFLPIYAQRVSQQAPSVIYGLILIAVMFLLPTGAAGLMRRLLAPLTRLYSRVVLSRGEA